MKKIMFIFLLLIHCTAFAKHQNLLVDVSCKQTISDAKGNIVEEASIGNKNSKLTFSKENWALLANSQIIHEKTHQPEFFILLGKIDNEMKDNVTIKLLTLSQGPNGQLVFEKSISMPLNKTKQFSFKQKNYAFDFELNLKNL